MSSTTIWSRRRLVFFVGRAVHGFQARFGPGCDAPSNRVIRADRQRCRGSDGEHIVGVWVWRCQQEPRHPPRQRRLAHAALPGQQPRVMQTARAKRIEKSSLCSILPQHILGVSGVRRAVNAGGIVCFVSHMPHVASVRGRGNGGCSFGALPPRPCGRPPEFIWRDESGSAREKAGHSAAHVIGNRVDVACAVDYPEPRGVFLCQGKKSPRASRFAGRCRNLRTVLRCRVVISPVPALGPGPCR